VLQVHDTHAALGNADILYLCGGGLMAHPDGPAAGVTALREAWDAALAGEALAVRAARVPALRRAIEFYRA
jgi:ribulose-bisphosphate carboxylase large chain